MRMKRARVLHNTWDPRLAWGFLTVSLCFLFAYLNLNALPKSMRLRVSTMENTDWISTATQPFDIYKADRLKNLIIVACHSMTLTGHLHDADADENDWVLADYQVGRGLPRAIYLHIEAGITHAAMDSDALLVFSGGETRSLAPYDEGSSYFRVADAMHMFDATQLNDSLRQFPGSDSVRSRTTTETFATDSFQNLLFSVCRFKEVTGRYPDNITMVSFSFKGKRFSEMHARAIHWPEHAFHYVGIDPEESTGFNLQEASKGEFENAARPFKTDPYGCHSNALIQKRKQRNPLKRTPPYELSCPDLANLLNWCEQERIPKHMVPWINALH